MKKNILPLLAVLALSLFLMFETKASDEIATEAPSLMWTEYKINPTIFDIAVGDEYVWGAHTEGVIRWDKVNHTYTQFTQAEGLIDSYVTAVEIDNNGNVWFGTPSGLSRLSGDSWSHFTTSNGLVNNSVLSLSLGPNGELLVGTTDGLSIFDGASWSSYVNDPITDPNDCLIYGITDTEIAANGYIWISTTIAATCYFNGSTWNVLYRNATSVNSDKIEFSDNGDLWLAGVYHENEYGVMLYEADGTWHHFTEADGLLDDETTSITIDSTGDVWVGINGTSIFDQGVSHFDGVTWTSSTFADGYYGAGVRAIEATDSGEIWTGSTNNVSQFQNNKWQAYLAGPPRGFAYEMIFDPNGHLWMSLYGNGVVEFDGEKWIHYTKTDGLAGDHVADIFVDNEGNMWFACYEEVFDIVGRGLTKFDGVNWQTFTMGDGLASDNIEDIAMDSSGDLWVAHRYGSVDRMTDSGWVNYSTADGLLYERVSTIFTQGNVLWFSHQGNYAFESGVSRFDGTNWSSYESELMFEKVNNFTTDSNGTLHALAENGVNVFDGVNWNGYALPDVTQFDPPSFGFTAKDLTFDGDGNLWIVGSQDVLLFDGTDWFLFNEANTLVSRLEEEIAIDPTGSNIWVDSQGGVVNFYPFEAPSTQDFIFIPTIQK